ncbi:MAG: HEPN domain-containing protein [Deltaproteobacteria bacterium]|nr:HEPN domain-containing protein [Deltaproteobacteria bacterium]
MRPFRIPDPRWSLEATCRLRIPHTIILSPRTTINRFAASPYTRLAETAAIELEEERLDFLRKLSSYDIQTRYPEEIAALAGSVSATQARETLRRTEELIRWVESIP